MPTFFDIQSQFDKAKSRGLIRPDETIADFARLGAAATGDPSYKEVANSSGFKNWVRGVNTSLDQAIQSGPVDDWTAELFGRAGDVFGVTPEVSRQTGREFPRQVVNFLPMMVGGAIGSAIAPGPGTAVGASIGTGLTSGLSALDAYGKSGSIPEAAIGAVTPYVGGKLAQWGATKALKSAATPGSLFSRLGFTGGEAAEEVLKSGVTLSGRKVMSTADNLLSYISGQAAANAGFAGLEALRHGPEAVLNKDYMFSTLATNLAFAAGDIPNYPRGRWAWEPEQLAPRVTADDISAAMSKHEKTTRDFLAITSDLDKFQREMELGIDIGKYVQKENEVSSLLQGYRTAVKAEYDNFADQWAALRTQNPNLPPYIKGAKIEGLENNPWVIEFDPARSLIQKHKVNLEAAETIKSAGMKQAALSKAKIENVLGLVEDDLQLPSRLLNLPVKDRTWDDYNRALGGKMSEAGLKILMMRHKKLADAAYKPEWAELWKDYQDAISGNFKGSLDDRYELLAAGLLANGKWPKVVEVQKRVAKKAKNEGLTEGEATKKAAVELANESKSEGAVEAALKPGKTEPTKESATLGRPTLEQKYAKLLSEFEPVLKAAATSKNTDENTQFLKAAHALIVGTKTAAGLKGKDYTKAMVVAKAIFEAKGDLTGKLQKLTKALDDISTSPSEARGDLSLEALQHVTSKDVEGDEGVVVDPDAVEFVDSGTPDPDAALREQVRQELLDKNALAASSADLKAAAEFMVKKSKANFEKTGKGKPLTIEEAFKILFKDFTPSRRQAYIDGVKNGTIHLAAGLDPETLLPQQKAELNLRDFARIALEEMGYDSATMPAHIEDFVRIAEMFNAPEVRYGKLKTELDLSQALFARAPAGGGFYFGMAEFDPARNAIVRPGGKLLPARKDGTISEQELRTSGGELGPLKKEEVDFYKLLVPEAFKNDRVHVKTLWDGLKRAEDSVRVVVYGQGGTKESEFERAQLSHEWLETLPEETRRLVEDYRYSVDDDSALNLGDPEDLYQQLAATGVDMAKVNRWVELNATINNARLDGPRATSYYNQISPFDTKKYPVMRVDVVLPIGELKGNETSAQLNAAGDARKPLWRPDNLHENLPNTLGWAMVQVVPHPVTGEKVMFVGEAQSRWGQEQQKMQKAIKQGGDPRYAGDRDYAAQLKQIDHPLLPIHQNLILKSVIKEAQKQGIKKVAISDGETAMMTEGHDKAASTVGHEQFNNREDARNRAIEVGGRLTETNGIWHVDWINKRPIVSQEGGMRLAYDTTMPSIMSKLVGEGKVEDFGVHKNASEGIPDNIDQLQRALAAGDITQAAFDEYTKPPIKGSPVFRTPSGTPKTNVTARVYDISNPSERTSALFAKAGDQPQLSHFTNRQFDEFRGDIVFASDDPAWASKFGDRRIDLQHDTLPTLTFDPARPKHVQELELQMIKDGVDATLAARLADKISDPNNTDNWTQIEQPPVQKALRGLGYEAFKAREEGRNIWGFYRDRTNVSSLSPASAPSGPIYGAAFQKLREIFLNPKAFKGPKAAKAFAFVLGHENAHIVHAKALKGEYGPEVQSLFTDAENWVKSRDPRVLRDVEEVIYDLFLPKAFKRLRGVEDILRNSKPEEWLANAHAMMVMGMSEARKPVSAFTILPKPFRAALDWMVSKFQDALRGAKIFFKLNGSSDKIQMVNRVKEYADKIRRSMRKAEWETVQAQKLFDIDPNNLQRRMTDALFAKDDGDRPYGAGTITEKLGNFFNNSIQGIGDFAANFPFMKEPALALVRSNEQIQASQVAALTPLFGHRNWSGGTAVDKDMPVFKVGAVKPLYELLHRITVSVQDEAKSVIKQNPDGTSGFDWTALRPEHRAELKKYSSDLQDAALQTLMSMEKSTGITQKVIVAGEQTSVVSALADQVAHQASFKLDYKEARKVAADLFAAVREGDQETIRDLLKAFDDPLEGLNVVKTAEAWNGKLKELEDLYAGRPNFLSLRRFGKIVQKFTKPGEEPKTKDFKSEAEAYRVTAELEAQGWKREGRMKAKQDKSRTGSITIDDRVMQKMLELEQSIKDGIDGLNVDQEVKSVLKDRASFVESVVRESKAADIYLPGVNRRVSGDPEALDLLQQHLLYTRIAHKVAWMKGLRGEINHMLGNPALEGKIEQVRQFKRMFDQSEQSDHPFWRQLNKVNAVWHIGFNFPGHMVELFQPVMSHLEEMIAQGSGLMGGLKMLRKAETDAMKVYGKLAGAKLSGKEDQEIWNHWPDKDEADMLRTNWTRIQRNPLGEIFDKVGLDADNFRRSIQGERQLTAGEAIAKPFNLYANAAMGLYSKFVQHNALVGLINGYRLARKRGLSHDEAVKEAELFDLAVNNSGGRLERPAYFSKLGGAGHVVYALSSYVRGRFAQMARYMRHGWDSSSYPELTAAQRTNAKKAFATMVLAQIGAAGVLGFPFVGAGLALMEDLTGEELKGKALAALNEVTDDPTLTTALGYGVISNWAQSLGIPADLHSRFALNGFLGINAYDGISSASILGPTASIVNSLWGFGKTLSQEKDLAKALAKGGPGGIKRLAEALSGEFQTQNPNASLPLTALGFRGRDIFGQKEMSRILTKQKDEARLNLQRAAQTVLKATELGPNEAKLALAAEAQKLVPAALEGRARAVVMRQTLSELRQKVQELAVRQEHPRDIRTEATARTAPAAMEVARALGLVAPSASQVSEELVRSHVGQLLGHPRPASALQRARQRDLQFQQDPYWFE